MELGDLTVEVASHDAFAQQFKAAHLGFNKAEVGMKFGRWIDVGYWEFKLAK